MALGGKKLIDEVLTQTDLPVESIQKELNQLITSAGVTAETLSLQQLRELMVDYLQDTLLEAREHLSKTDS